MTAPQVRTDPNWLGAFFSFLRVLAVAVASALAPMFVGADDFPTAKATVIAVVAAFLLTVVNFLRPGEIRFGQPPNVTDAGYAEPVSLAWALVLLGLVLVVVGLAWVPTFLWLGVVIAVVGLVLLLV